MMLGEPSSLSAVLFAIGVVGVLTRRNAIIIFMCVELMLNAVNLSFVALRQAVRRRPGTCSSIFVMTDRRGRGGGRAGDHHLDLPPLRQSVDLQNLNLLQRLMLPPDAAAPAHPLDGTVARVDLAAARCCRCSASLLNGSCRCVPRLRDRRPVRDRARDDAGRRRPRDDDGHHAPCRAAPGRAGRAAGRLRARRSRIFGAMRRRAGELHDARSSARYATWMPVGDLVIDWGVPARPALDGDGARHHRRRLADPRVLRRLHAGRPGYARYFAYLNLFVFFMLVLVLGASYPVMFVGWEGRGALLVPAHRLLVQRAGQRGRRQEGVHRQSHR